MNESTPSRITQPLRDLAGQAPATLFNIVVRAVITPEADFESAYGKVPAILQQVKAAIDGLGLAANENSTWSGEQVVSPFLFATLARVLTSSR